MGVYPPGWIDAPPSFRLPGRVAAPGEEGVVFEVVLAVGERAALDAHDRTASGFEDRLTGGGVPFHRRAEARVEIGLTRRQHAEFKRAAAADPFEDRAALEVFGEAAAVVVGAAVDDREARWGGRPGADLLGRAAVFDPDRGAGAVRGVSRRDRRTVDNAEHRAAILDEADAHGELAVLGDELLGAVKR